MYLSLHSYIKVEEVNRNFDALYTAGAFVESTIPGNTVAQIFKAVAILLAETQQP